MKTLVFLKSKEKKRIVEELEERFGIEELNYLLLETGKKKIRGFSGSLSKDEIQELNEAVNIEIIGIYLINKKDDDLRLAFDVIPLLRKQIVKGRVEINKEQLELWLRGNDLEVKSERGPVVLSYGGDLVGAGKSNGEKVFNYVPKERKLKIPIRS